MSCEDLLREIKDTEQKMRVLDKQIALQQQGRHQDTGTSNAQSAQRDSHNIPVPTTQSDSATNQPMDAGQLKVNYIERHHALMRIYFERCVLSRVQPPQIHPHFGGFHRLPSATDAEALES